MGINDIPVRVVGPGSQETGDKALTYMQMPSGMSTYSPPRIEEPDRILDMAGVREAVDWLRRALSGDGTESERANLSALDASEREIVNQMLGEGEVSITYDAEFRARTQESVLAGVWRTFCFDEDDQLIADIVEVAPVPRQVLSNVGRDRPVNTSSDGVPQRMGNALSILVELEAHVARFAADRTPNIINLSLLPLSDEELEFLDERLGRGPTDILSRAYGKCQVISTRTPNVWWVRYYNSMSTLILNTIEIADVPQVVCAAPEDLRDSAIRFDKILAPYGLGNA